MLYWQGVFGGGSGGAYTNPNGSNIVFTNCVVANLTGPTGLDPLQLFVPTTGSPITGYTWTIAIQITGPNASLTCAPAITGASPPGRTHVDFYVMQLPNPIN